MTLLAGAGRPWRQLRQAGSLTVTFGSSARTSRSGPTGLLASAVRRNQSGKAVPTLELYDRLAPETGEALSA